MEQVARMSNACNSEWSLSLVKLGMVVPLVSFTSLVLDVGDDYSWAIAGDSGPRGAVGAGPGQGHAERAAGRRAGAESRETGLRRAACHSAYLLRC